jgi:hypothetical protein
MLGLPESSAPHARSIQDREETRARAVLAYLHHITYGFAAAGSKSAVRVP